MQLLEYWGDIHALTSRGDQIALLSAFKVSKTYSRFTFQPDHIIKLLTQ
jgi:hypothetical protein